MKKTCSKCKEYKKDNKFSKDKSTPTGLNGWCKKCVAEKRKSRASYYRNYNFVRYYGVTTQDRNNMHTEQNGKCKICKRPIYLSGATETIACIDHSHETGEVRGLLCQDCNRGLGLFKDSKEFLLEAARYL